MPSPFVRHWKRDGAEVYIGRPSRFGNPFQMASEDDREAAVSRFREWFLGCEDMRRVVRRELAGKSLGCFCAPGSCHGDVLAEVANDPAIDPSDPVFVFGSNEAGAHGRGAARFAAQHRGARTGIGEGRQGRSYGIPTKDKSLKRLSLTDIAGGVERFLEHARAEASTQFDVTRVGCGLAGYKDEDIAPLFSGAPSNCRLPYRWARAADPSLPPRVIIAGSRTIDEKVFPTARIDALLAHLQDPIIVSGGADGVDQLGEAYAIARGLRFIRVPAEWERYRTVAGPIRNQHMSGILSTHLIAVWDGQSTGTKHMIDAATNDELAVRTICVTPTARDTCETPSCRRCS